MQTRRLGRLEHRSSVLIHGGAGLGQITQDVADRNVEQALAAGINHFDVAASYGEAELRLGALMSTLRPKIFLATKTGEREQDAAWQQINASLERLQTDKVDLLQLHAVGDLTELDKVTGEGGALQAAVRAQEEGLVMAIGITGHGPDAAATHLEALRRFPFATVLTPLNAALWADTNFRDNYTALVAEVRRQDAGLMTMKSCSWRNWPDTPEGAFLNPDRSSPTWYEPLTDPELIRAAVSWVLAHDEITGTAIPGDVGLLEAVVDAERDPISANEAEEVLARVPGYSSPFLAMPGD